MAKSAVKPIFSPLPHPTFFAPKSPLFPLFPVSNPISGDFSRARTRFLPCEAHFFLVSLHFGSDFGRFFEGSLPFFPFYRLFSFPFSHFESKFPRFFDGYVTLFSPNFNFSSLFPVLPHASGTCSRDPTLYFPSTPLCAQREGFSDSGFPSFFTPCPTLTSRSPSSAPHSPTLHPLPPLFFSFLPTFPPPSPINARTRAPSRNTRARARSHIPARQEVFVYCLHLFTHFPQSAVHQRVRGEGKEEKAFTKHSITSQSKH